MTQVHNTNSFSCPKCSSTECTYKYLKAPKDIPKGETWGNKDTPEIISELNCKKCGYTWQTESEVF